MDGPDAAREYYRAIDEGDYAALSDLIADGFVHGRPDRTIEGREEPAAVHRLSRRIPRPLRSGRNDTRWCKPHSVII